MEIPRTQWAVQLTGPGELTLTSEKPVPRPGPHQILAKVEAVGLCFSDLKLLKQFDQHVRKAEVVSGLDRDVLASNPAYVPGTAPTVPGHEVVCRVVAVGEGVTRYRAGDRLVPQPDWRSVRTPGSNAALGYNFEGALQEFILLDERILHDADGNDRYVFPVGDGPSAASLALVEPWGCVENSYTTRERDRVKPGGKLLVVGLPGATVYGLEGCLSPDGPPGTVTALVAGPEQREAVRGLGLPVADAASLDGLSDEGYDDIICFGSDPRVLEVLNDKLASGALMNVVLGGHRLGEPVNVGVGRIHYGPTRWIGTPGGDASASYGIVPRVGEVREGDSVLVIGAGGPMGQMHVIRALSSGIPGISVTATDTDPDRLDALRTKARPIADSAGVPFETVLADRLDEGAAFSYIAIMAPVAPLLVDAIARAATGAIINVFAGIPAPVKHPIDLDAVFEKGTYVFGTSGSETEDMRAVLAKVLSGRLETEASMDAVCGMAGARDALEAVENRTLAGKIIVYPQLHDVSLLPLAAVRDLYPSVSALMRDGRWTSEAEKEFLQCAGKEGEGRHGDE